MGKIKSKQVWKVAKTLNKENVEITDDFETNKKILEGLTPSKKIRNQIAGLLAKMKKREIQKEG